MTHRSLAVLIVLNVVLLAGLTSTVFSPAPAEAQFGGGRQYTMIAGQATGRSGQSVIYITDLTTGRIATLFYNGSSKEFEFFRGRNIGSDAQGAGTGR